ncbi:MAG: response regulator [Planctomycetota bacterium]
MNISELSIMIVEDNRILQRTMLELLEDHGYHNLHAFSDGMHAIRYFQESTADLVVLDVEIPGINGLDVLVQFKSLKPRMPVVMVSSLHDRRILMQACESGASTFFPKPLDSEMFCRKIEELLRQVTFYRE